ncbi:hypothetical protein D3C87_1194150 [compost metagenome]
MAPRGHRQRAVRFAAARGQGGADHQVHEAAGAVQAHRLPGVEAAQPDGAGKLVAGAGEDGHVDAEQVGARAAEVIGVLPQLGQQLTRKVECIDPIREVAVLAEHVGAA